MKFYYIDDTMFQKGTFQEEIRHRFLHHIRRNKVRLILVSAFGKETEAYQEFLTQCTNIKVLRSPALFDIDGIAGNLHSTFLGVEGYPLQQSYSGTCVEYDEDTKQVQRIYLDLFTTYHEEETFDFLVEELEKAIQDKIHTMKKKKQQIH